MEKTKTAVDKRRRRFLQGLGTAFAGIVSAAPALAQPTAPQLPPLRVIDFQSLRRIRINADRRRWCALGAPRILRCGQSQSRGLSCASRID